MEVIVPIEQMTRRVVARELVREQLKRRYQLLFRQLCSGERRDIISAEILAEGITIPDGFSKAEVIAMAERIMRRMGRKVDHLSQIEDKFKREERAVRRAIQRGEL